MYYVLITILNLLKLIILAVMPSPSSHSENQDRARSEGPSHQPRSEGARRRNGRRRKCRMWGEDVVYYTSSDDNMSLRGIDFKNPDSVG